MKAVRAKVKRGQVWIDKNTGREFTITRKASGNRHWQGTNGNKTHQIHEATLEKYFTLKINNESKPKDSGGGVENILNKLKRGKNGK